jgi:hypothetical protein
MEVVDIGLVPVDLNGIRLQRPSDGRTDNVDDAGFGDDVVSRVERIEGAGLFEQGIFRLKFLPQQDEFVSQLPSDTFC